MKWNELDSEIGVKHIDNDRDRINVQGFDSSNRRSLAEYKVELIKICDTILQNQENELAKRQENEIALNDQIVGFSTMLEAEIY